MPVELSFNERRVLGTLIEKGFTTPEQYPLSLNSVVLGCNQKSCREPMSSIDEEKALDTLESLQSKGFAVLVRMAGSRVDRWKHKFGEALTLESKEVAILGELLLRGPQSEGELRSRASRMRPMEELEQLVESMRSRPDALVVRLGPPGRSRGVKLAHTFYPAAERPTADATDEDGETYTPASSAPSPAAVLVARQPQALSRTMDSYASPVGPSSSVAGASGAELAELRREMQSLKDRVAELEATFVKFFK